jgi:transposase-like protein
VSTKRLVTISALVAALAGGAVAAVAATNKDDAKKTEDAILADAAKRLNVSPDQLRDALSKAEDAQLDQAVKDGKLTQEQADEIKKHRDAEGRVLGIPPGGPHGFHGHFFGGPGAPGFVPGGPGGAELFGRGFGPPDILGTVAKELGLSQNELFKQFREGKSLSQIAKAKGKSLSDVEDAVKAAVAKKLDAEVKAGRLTDKQRDEILKEISAHISHLGDMKFGRFGMRLHFRGGRPPFMPDARPGTSAAPDAPPSAPTI